MRVITLLIYKYNDYVRVITLFIYIIRIYTCIKKSPTFMKIVGRGLVYFFMNRELNDIAIRIINIKSTMILLIKRLILSRLYRI